MTKKELDEYTASAPKGEGFDDEDNDELNLESMERGIWYDAVPGSMPEELGCAFRRDFLGWYISEELFVVRTREGSMHVTSRRRQVVFENNVRVTRFHWLNHHHASVVAWMAIPEYKAHGGSE